jgi:hypothetical protein
MWLWASGLETARVRAIAAREESGATTPEEFADYRGIKLYDVKLKGAGAQLIDGPRGTHILLPDTLTDPIARAWSIAHELGHYEMRHRSPPAHELGAPRPARQWNRAMRDDEDEANEWAMMFSIPDAEVALYCDQMPMTLDVVTELARRCSVPPIAAALRLTSATIRYCAAVLSQDGKIVWASPSMHLLGYLGLVDGHQLKLGSQIGHGALAREFFDTRKLRRGPALVPAAAWIESLSDNAWIQEHSMEAGPPGAVLTMLWAPNDPDVTRDLLIPPRLMPAVRDICLSDETTRIEHIHKTYIRRPCPFAPTWLDALLYINVQAAG